MWTWNSDPFGTDAANASPSGAGMFAYNLRFPGQVFDGQAGLHQNYFRDFDPAIGRYARSDLMDLRGGVNTYAYVGGNPISLIDPFGLTAEDVNVINQYITHNFPDISRRGGYEFGEPGSGANASTAWTGVTTLRASIRCKKLSLDEFENLFDTMLHESMHSTDNALRILWDGLWGNDYLTSNHQGIFNRVQYETQFGHRYPAKSPMWGTPTNFVPDVVDLYNRSREQANKDQCGCL